MVCEKCETKLSKVIVPDKVRHGDGRLLSRSCVLELCDRNPWSCLYGERQCAKKDAGTSADVFGYRVLAVWFQFRMDYLRFDVAKHTSCWRKLRNSSGRLSLARTLVMPGELTTLRACCRIF